MIDLKYSFRKFPFVLNKKYLYVKNVKEIEKKFAIIPTPNTPTKSYKEKKHKIPNQ